MRKCLFLDRDGVINHDPGTYTFRVEDFQLLPSVVPVLKALQERGYVFVVITNQGGVAKGLYTKEDVLKVHYYLRDLLSNEGVELLDIFYSLHHDKIGASIDRKPDSLMLERAIYLHSISPEDSYMVGDKDSDIQAAEKVGVKGVKIPTNGDLYSLLELLKG